MLIVDTSGLEIFAIDVSRAIGELNVEAYAVVKRGAQNITKDWRDFAQTVHKHAPEYPYSIGYDPPTVEGGVIEAVIGPDKEKDGKQGALGNLIEFGSPTSAPHNFGGQALDHEAPKFEAAAEALMSKVLW